MEPNQQDPYQPARDPGQPSPSPAPYPGLQPVAPPTLPTPSNVPEYLHLDTVPETQPKKSHKKLILFAGPILALILLVGGAAFWSSQNGASESRFYDALSTLMNTSVVHREISATTQKPVATTLVSADSDFSDPAKPKSKFIYTYKVTQSSNQARQDTVAGDVYIQSDGTYVGRITTPPLSWTKNLQKNQWYTVDVTKQTPSDPDVLGLHQTVNNTVGVVAIGKYTDARRTDVLSYIKTNGIYTLQSTRSQSQNGKQYDVYSVKVDYGKLAQLNSHINTLLQTSNTATAITTVNPVDFWVDSGSGWIVKIVENVKQSDVLSVNLETTLAYPSTVDVSTPVGAKS